MEIKIKVIDKLRIILVASVFGILIGLFGYFYYQFEKHKAQADNYDKLKAIAQLKTNEIVQWRKERLSEAIFFSNNENIINNTVMLLADNSKSKEELIKELNHILSDNRYENIFVLSPNGSIVFTFDSTLKSIDTSTLILSNKALKIDTVLFSDFYRCEIHSRVYLDLIAPIKDKNKRNIATLVFRINPNSYLFPLIQTWPTPSKTAETLIVKREKDSVLFINRLRHSDSEPLTLRISLKSNITPAVRAALNQEGIFEGVDYRGKKVLTEIKKIPDTPWVMVAKIDLDEIYTDLKSKAFLIIVLSIITMLLVIIIMTWLYQLRQRNIYEKLLKKELELFKTQEQFRATLYSIGDGVITTDNNGSVQYMNHVAEKLTGWKEKEAKGKNLEKVFNIIDEESRLKTGNPLSRVLNEKIIVNLASHTLLISKHGEEIPISHSGAPIFNENNEIIGVVFVFRSQIEERSAQKALSDSVANFKAVTENANDGIIVALIDGTHVFVNRRMSKIIGYSVEEICTLGLKGYAHPDELPKLTERIKKRLAGEDVQSQYETMLINKQGVNVPVEITASKSLWLGQPADIVILRDITKRKQVEEALRESESKFRAFFENSMDAIMLTSPDGNIYSANPAACKMLERTEAEICELGRDGLVDIADPRLQILLDERLQKGKAKGEFNMLRRDGTSFPVEVTSSIFEIGSGVLRTSMIIRDITERNLINFEKDISLKILQKINSSNSLHELIADITASFKQWLHCDAVGIRLKEGDDYPYFETRGFPTSFVELERSLCSFDEKGEIIRDENFNPKIECMCGNVIQGRFNPDLTFFTKNGSFWSNSTTRLLATTNETDRQSSRRNRCNGEGYESVALIPLRAGESTLGLLQINSFEKDKFTEDLIQVLERLAINLALGLTQRQADGAMKESEQRFRSLFENMINGLAYCKMLYVNGEPSDFRYLSINSAFEKLTGLKDVTGKLVSQVIPGIRETDPKLFELYGRVALTGIAESLELYIESLNDWYSISVYCPQKEYFVAIFDVITRRKEVEEALKESEQFARSTLDGLSANIAIVDESGLILAVNNSWRNFASQNASLLTGLFEGANYLDACDNAIGDDAEIAVQFAKELRSVLVGKKNEFGLEYSCHSPEEKRWFIARITKFPGDGKSRAIVAHENITQRKLAEEALLENEHRLSSIYDAVGDVIYSLAVEPDDQFRFISTNKAFSNITGLKEEMIVGKLLNEVIPEPSLSYVIEKYKQAIRQNSILSWEEISNYPNGQLTGEVTISPVFDKNGHCTNIVGSVHDITQRKRIENKLRENESRLREVQEIAHFGYWYWDVKTGDIEWSEEVYKIFQLDPNTFKPKVDSILDLSPWSEDHQRDKELLDIAIRTHKSGSYEQKFLFPDKSIGYYYSTFHGNYNEKGELIAIVGSVLDITERKRAEEALQESKEQLRFAFEGSNDGLWDVSLIDGSVYLSPRGCEILGYEPDELSLVVKAWSELVHPDDLKYTNERLESHLKGETPIFEAEQRLRMKSGEWKWILARGKVVSHDQNGKPMRITGTHSDITERKKTQQEIILLNNQLHNLINVIKQLALANDMDSIMKSVRTAARNLINADGATFVLKENGNCFYADEDAISPLWKGLRFPIDNCISGWAMINRQTVAIKDIYLDSRIPLDAYRPTFVKSLLMVPINTADPKGAIGLYWANEYSPKEEEILLIQTLADATSIALENLKTLEDLELRVTQRTQQLETANRELETFSYSVSHDLRAPLRAIHGFIQIIAEEYKDKLDEEGLRLMTIVSDNTNRMGQLIDDLLAFSRINRVEIKKSTIATESMVSAVLIDLLSPEQKDKIKIRINQLPDILGDTNLFRQVWTNLLSNALKYTSKKEEPSIEIGFKENPNDYEFYIKDNGAGFDMLYIDKLFKVFQRLHSNRDFEGTGIGLVIVHNIITRHGGKVWAEGEVDNGATFYFTVPKLLSNL